MSLRSIDGSPIAFTFNCITFYGPNRKWLHQTWEINLDPAIVAEIQLRWTVQKNLKNGETNSQARIHQHHAMRSASCSPHTSASTAPKLQRTHRHGSVLQPQQSFIYHKQTHDVSSSSDGHCCSRHNIQEGTPTLDTTFH